MPAGSNVKGIISPGTVGLPITVTFCPSPNIGDETGLEAGAAGVGVGLDVEGVGEGISGAGVVAVGAGGAGTASAGDG